jgi:hypothetical protein
VKEALCAIEIERRDLARLGSDLQTARRVMLEIVLAPLTKLKLLIAEQQGRPRAAWLSRRYARSLPACVVVRRRRLGRLDPHVERLLLIAHNAEQEILGHDTLGRGKLGCLAVEFVPRAFRAASTLALSSACHV